MLVWFRVWLNLRGKFRGFVAEIIRCPSQEILVKKSFCNNDQLQVLLVHASPLSCQGGAEHSLRYHVEHRPPKIDVDVVTPDESPNLKDYDVVVLGNLRPEGGLGEEAEVRWVKKWAQVCQGFAGFSLKSERDAHPCAHRDARCVVMDPVRKLECDCGLLIPTEVENLYNSCSAVQFMSPAHKQVINCLTEIHSAQVVIGVPVDESLFRLSVPLAERPVKALIFVDEIRTSPEAPNVAIQHGFEPEFIPYHSVPYDDMPDLLNGYQAIILYPKAYHAFCRLVVEAKLCGCQVIASNRVGALSWEDPVAAARNANHEFWSLIKNNTGFVSKSLRSFRKMFWL